MESREGMTRDLLWGLAVFGLAYLLLVLLFLW